MLMCIDTVHIRQLEAFDRFTCTQWALQCHSHSEIKRWQLLIIILLHATLVSDLCDQEGSICGHVAVRMRPPCCMPALLPVVVLMVVISNWPAYKLVEHELSFPHQWIPIDSSFVCSEHCAGYGFSSTIDGSETKAHRKAWIIFAIVLVLMSAWTSIQWKVMTFDSLYPSRCSAFESRWLITTLQFPHSHSHSISTFTCD